MYSNEYVYMIGIQMYTLNSNERIHKILSLKILFSRKEREPGTHSSDKSAKASNP